MVLPAALAAVLLVAHSRASLLAMPPPAAALLFPALGPRARQVRALASGDNGTCINGVSEKNERARERESESERESERERASEVNQASRAATTTL